jgi:SAM-dependent methyltransferase
VSGTWPRPRRRSSSETYLDSLAPLVLKGRDISLSMIEPVLAYLPHRRSIVADLGSIPFDSASFDGVLAGYSIIHTPPSRLPDLIAELRRVLRPNGALLLGFQAGKDFRNITGAYDKNVELTAYMHRSQKLSICPRLWTSGCSRASFGPQGLKSATTKASSWRSAPRCTDGRRRSGKGSFSRTETPSLSKLVDVPGFANRSGKDPPFWQC